MLQVAYSINQSINLSIDQLFNQSIHQSINQSINHTIKQLQVGEPSPLHKYGSANAKLAAALSRGDFCGPTSPTPLSQRPVPEALTVS